MTTRFKLPKNIDRQVVAQAILVVLFLLACFWISAQPNPFEANETPPPPPEGQMAHPNPSQLALNATAYQVEIEQNRDQTMGVVFGGTFLVVLIIVGTLLVIGRR